jgi:phosphatidylglycerophosphate synthase
VESPLLPRFESWHSGVLPYPVLFIAQLFIIAGFARTAARFGNGDVVPRYRRGVFFLLFGSVYFLTMFARLLLGFTVYRENRWFASYIPTVFHLVLATWLLLYGHYHHRYGSKLRDAKGAATRN